MKTKQLITIVLSIIASFHTVWAYPVCHITSYYETSKNEPLHHVCGMLQDQNGMIWIATIHRHMGLRNSTNRVSLGISCLRRERPQALAVYHRPSGY